MAQLKDLHLARRMEDLEQYAIIPDVRAKKMQMLLETARKLYQEAEKYNRDGDEELAYIFYMKYFNLLNCIHKKPDYSLHKQTVRKTLGGNESNKNTMDKLEVLSVSLSKRYGRLSDSTAASAHDKAKPTSPSLLTMPSLPSLQPQQKRSYNDLSSSEKFDHVKGDTSSGEPTLFNTITGSELFERMQGSSVLIMDCRSSSDYQFSHLTYPYALNVPEEIIRPGMSSGKLQLQLHSASRTLWAARSIKDYVVLMDWNCKDATPSKIKPIGTLLDILKNWDPDVTYRSPIKILEGGYEYFIMMYPTLCTNPSVQAPQQNDESPDLMDDIEYPSIHDITMKDDIRERSYELISNSSSGSLSTAQAATYAARPSIDRSSKMAAIKVYDEKQKPIVDILKEQEEMMEKAKANDEQLEQAAKKWVTIYEQKITSPEKTALSSSEQELLYNIMQLESAAEDYKIENIRLRDELERYKRMEKEQQVTTLSPNEAESLEQVTKQMENKIQERQRLDEQHEREKQQRDLQLAIAREHKRHMRPPADEDDEISKPKIPQIDRSIKPQVTAYPPAVAVQEPYRDFSPVPGGMGRGLTGLKNLGNTCYMNSILQCLSNTPQLKEYCITDKYKHCISRTNKTQGHIVEEVAALIKVLWNGNFKCVASKDLRHVIGQYQQIFQGIEQQDSHEFLTILMDWLHSDLQTLHVPRPRDNITASERAWLEFTKSKESLILHLFYGQIKSTVKCVDCNKESATYESFSNLSLELPSNGNVCLLGQCMDMYFSGEQIHGWNCPSCKQKRTAVKKLDISKLPPVLVIHLKRFYADPETIGNKYRKKQNYVRFPLRDLDMTPYIAKSESRSVTPKTYQLYGVSNHYGKMESGHYTAFCKSGNYGKWFKFDDQVVSALDTSSVVSSAAYILFYTWLPPTQISENN